MSFRQLDLHKDSAHISLRIGGLLQLPDDFAARHGVIFTNEDLHDGLGPVRAAVIETDSGNVLA